MARLTPLTTDQMTDEQRQVAEAIIGGPRGGLRGPFEAWLRSPVLADRAQRLGEYCRYNTSLAPHLSELAILLTGKHWSSQYEFFAHARLARQAGLPDDTIEAIRTGQRPALRDAQEEAVYDLVTEYLARHRVGDETYRQAVDVLGEGGVVDVVGIVGYYTLVSMTLNVFEVGLPEGEPLPFPEPPK
ncbi:MAG: carboxymuconolactone decarboxylase family protein [Dehalococcoidia bacterium]|nr:carboxymuconolactone decarboxylase family protein [Dehalococcoidia bacterium]